MKNCRWSSVVRVAVACACLGGVEMLAQVAKSPDAAAPAEAVQVLDKKQVSRMRGKLLYKRSQIRKLERAAAASHAQVAQRATELERQRREAYLAVEPKLAPLYDEQDRLDAQVKEAAAQLKKAR